MTSPKNHKLSNKEIVLLLREVLAAMEVKDVSWFRIRAYQNAISAIDNLTSSVYYLWENNKLDEIPGVGAALTQHFDDLFTQGSVKDFDAIREDLPQGMFKLIGLRGVGAKKAFKLATAFELTTRDTALQKLIKAAEQGRIQVLKGFGKTSEQKLLSSALESKKHKREKERLLLIRAEEISLRLLAYLEESDLIEKAVALGSLRRRESTVGDLDIAVATTNGKKALDHFSKFPELEEVLAKGEKSCNAVLNNDVQVDVKAIPLDAFGSMLQYFTGSKQHNVLLRTLALEKKMSLSEWGIKEHGKLLKFATEKSFYEHIGLDYIPPELRQGKHEIDLAKAHNLPDLVHAADIKGDLHMHTIASDGENTLDQMVKAAIALGYEYIGIADHAPSVINRGESAVLDIIRAQRKKIEHINKSQDKIKVLFGYEVNILADATLAMPNNLLKKLDYAIGSIHTAFKQDREIVTKRVINALKNPYISVIGHPSGRLINQREGCDIDWEQVFKVALEHNKIIEINAQPERLDLADDLVHEAVKKGVKLIINTDAHSVNGLNIMQYGIDVARRGWCTKTNLVNTLPLKDFLRVLKH